MLIRYNIIIGTWLFFILILFDSCDLFSKYKGYADTGTGVYYRLITFGEDEVKPAPGDYITIDLAYKTMDDSVFFQGRRKFCFAEPDFEGAIDECFARLSAGDSACFIINADDFFRRTLDTELPGFIPDNGDMKVNIKMLHIQKKEDFIREKEEFLHWIEDFEDYERIYLEHFIEGNELSIDPTRSGMYYIQLDPGYGKYVEYGDTVAVDYEGYFLNGDIFDSTIKREQPFVFAYGDEWQVIEGLEEAIGMMREGERAFVILPSHIAFGKTGSSTGIIPPYTTVLFEVKLLSVREGGLID